MLNSGDMALKKVLVGLDSGLWGQVKAAAAREERKVGQVVENALRLYLAGPVSAPEPFEPMARSDGPTFERASKVEALRELVALVPSRAPRELEDGRTETARERAQRIADAQAYYREHPEEEGQG